MTQLQKLKFKLEHSYKVYQSDEHLIGRLNDKLLHSILIEIQRKPSISNFVMFVSCINYFYSTRIQAANGAIGKNIIKIASILQYNWNRDIKLKRIINSSEIDPSKVDELRRQIKNAVKRDLFSLTTKIFHQLSSQYPIYDSRVNKFLKNRVGVTRINLSKDYSLFCLIYFIAMEDIEWSLEKVDQFDNAVWVLN
jgi:hypothetical protein